MTSAGPALERARASARAHGGRVVFPEWDEPRISDAVAQLRAQTALEPLPSGPVSEAQMAALVDERGVREGVARRMLARPMFRAAAMVLCGEADAMVAGAATPLRRVIEAASIVYGPAEGMTTASSFFVMVFPDGREMIWADCSVIVQPDALQLADIARASATSAQALFGTARVALLSFSTGMSRTGDSVDLIRNVADVTGFAGPVQGDTALSLEAAETKGAESGPGVGDANVLIFPDLNAGNIACRLVCELAGAQAIGPMLQGFAKPVCGLSRRSRPDDIVAATLLTLASA